MRRMLGLVSVGLLATAVSGCGGGDSKPGDDNTPLTPDAMCTQSVTAICEVGFKCAGSAAPDMGMGATTGECAANLAQMYCTADQLNCEQGTTFQSDQAKLCVAAMKAMTCDQVMSSPKYVPPACEHSKLCK